MIYVVMLTRATPGPDGRKASSERLSLAATAISETLVRFGRATGR